MRRKGKYTEGPWSNENLSHKVGGVASETG